MYAELEEMYYFSFSKHTVLNSELFIVNQFMNTSNMYMLIYVMFMTLLSIEVFALCGGKLPRLEHQDRGPTSSYD